MSPLERLETQLHLWVAYAIMPVFALANAGVRMESASLHDPISVAVILGLLVGKPAGIVLFSWAAVRFRLARRPEGVSWPVLVGGSCLAGIGFTMSLFIADIALPDDQLSPAKIGTLVGSALSAIIGSVLLLWFLRNKPGSSRTSNAD